MGSTKNVQRSSSLNQISPFFSKYPAIVIALGAARKISSVPILISENRVIKKHAMTENITKR